MTTEPQKPFAVGDKVTIMEHATPIETATVVNVNKRWLEVQHNTSRYRLHFNGDAMNHNGSFTKIEHKTEAHVSTIKRNMTLGRIHNIKYSQWAALSTEQINSILAMLDIANAARKP